MMPSGTSPYVLAFAKLMEAKLDENRHKGDREGWAQMSTRDLMERLRDEMEELKDALYRWEPGVIARECADVANYAMMIADVVGGLEPKFPPQDADWTLEPDDVDP